MNRINIAKTKTAAAAMVSLLCLAQSGTAFANEGPVERGIGLQPPATKVAEEIQFFHDAILLPIEIGIALLVLGLLIFVMFRFNEKANPEPAKFTHNVPLEIAWTGIPVLILIFISIFSFPLLYKEDVVPANVDLTIKATGHQWNWSYEYPDNGDISFTATMLSEADAKAQNKPFRLGTDAPIYVPVGKIVRVQITAQDVIHAWTVPAFGVKVDAMPGKLNQVWFKAERTGVFYGQCSEICGVDHASMPIEVHVVTQAEFDAWVASQTQASTNSIQFAQAQ